jgi:hypothetical protein
MRSASVRRRAQTARHAARQRVTSWLQDGRSFVRTFVPPMRITARIKPTFTRGEAVRDTREIRASQMPDHQRALLHAAARQAREGKRNFVRGFQK